MLRTFFSLLLSCLFFFSTTTPASAIFSTTPPGMFGQDHSYSVVLRGNGEAVVSAKIVFTNTTDTEFNNFDLRIPKVEPRDIIVYQVIFDGPCVQYMDGPNGPYLYPTGETKGKCELRQDPDYYSYYGGGKYLKAKSEVHGDTLEITLPKSVNAEKSGAFLIYYRASGYATKDFLGRYKYAFETLKVEDKIRNLTVGVSSDSDLFLKGLKSDVNYRFNESMMSVKTTDISMGSPVIDNYYQQIGRGVTTKTASNLQPLDSFTVEGEYASSWWILYFNELLIAALVVFVLITLLVFIIKRLGKSIASPLAISISTGFISALLVMSYTAGLIFLNSFLRQMFGYSELLTMMGILIVIVSVAFYSLLIVGTSIFVGLKKGAIWGLGTFATTVVCLIIDMAFAFIVIYAFNGNPRPVYLPGEPRIMMDAQGASSESTAK